MAEDHEFGRVRPAGLVPSPSAAGLIATPSEGDRVTALLDEHDRAKAGEQDFVPAMSREKATALIHGALWAFGVRSNSTAGGYAYLGILDTLGFEMSESGWRQKAAQHASDTREASKRDSARATEPKGDS